MMGKKAVLLIHIHQNDKWEIEMTEHVLVAMLISVRVLATFI